MPDSALLSVPDENWPPAWTRAALEMCVLAAIAQSGTTHGYEIVRTLQSAGLGEIKGGTLYPALARLEEQGLISAHWVDGAGGPGRKLVTITDSGKSERIARRDRWRTWTAHVEALINQIHVGAKAFASSDEQQGNPRNRAEQRNEQ